VIIMLRIFPLLSIPVVLYFVLVGRDATGLTTEVANFKLVSGAIFSINASEMLILFGMAVLFLEILKATMTGLGTIWDHALSLMLFIICLVAFISLPIAATPTFLFLTAITLIDVIAGYSIAIRHARRDVSIM